MTNINWTTPRFVDLPDLRMAVFEAGSPSPTHPTIILCHGFPEIAYSWRHIIAPLADLGYHVIAPDLRGFGATGNPLSDPGDATGVTLFDMQHLCDDMAHLLEIFETATMMCKSELMEGGTLKLFDANNNLVKERRRMHYEPGIGIMDTPS